MFIQTYNYNGIPIEECNRPSLEHVKNSRINDLRNETTNLIREKVADYDESNAALGILTPEETESIKNHIISCRKAYKIAKEKVLKSESFEEIATIYVIDSLVLL